MYNQPAPRRWPALIPLHPRENKSLLEAGQKAYYAEFSPPMTDFFYP